MDWDSDPELQQLRREFVDSFTGRIRDLAACTTVEAIGDLASRIGIVPDWLPGWWEVTDIFETYYYYFYRTGTVYATKERPGMPVCPLTTKENSGAFKIDTLRKISIQWAASDSRAESFTLVESVSPPTLAGSHPDTPAAPFKARKMF